MPAAGKRLRAVVEATVLNVTQTIAANECGRDKKPLPQPDRCAGLG
jgi:hypothetical protein